MVSLTPFPKFDVYSEENSLGVRWNKYVSKLENLFVGLNIDARKRKKALLLHYAGDEVFDIYQTLNLEDNDSNYNEVKDALTRYFNPRKNKEFERYEFRNLNQQPNESIDQFATRLRQKANNCEFLDKEGEIKSQIIQGCTSKTLRMKCLQEDKQLNDLLTLARTMEISEKQASIMENHDSPKVDRIKPKSRNQKSRSHKPVHMSATNRSCRNCGKNYPHQDKCPALGATCNYCHKKNHFIAVCRKRNRANKYQGQRVNEIEESDSESSENDQYSENAITFGMSEIIKSVGDKVPKVTVSINGVYSKVLVDTGSSINIISESLIKKMIPEPKASKSPIKAYAFGQKKPLTMKCKYTLPVESKSKIIIADFHVVAGASETLLSYKTAVDLGIVPVINSVQPDKYKELSEKYKSVFTGLGKLKDCQVKFHIDESVIPTAQQPRRIPFHLRDQVNQELKRLEQLDVIEKVEGPTPWVSNMVIAPKPKTENEIRICVDMRKANQALKPEHYVTPTIDDIIHELNGSTVFSKVDLYKGYHQLELHEKSRNITAFNGPDSLWRYKRLNMGVSVAPSIFQREIRQIVQGLKMTLNVSDDIIVHGKSREEHDENLENLLKTLQEKHLTVNEAKCEFGKSKLTFYGYVFSAAGISPCPDKIKAINNMEKPQNQSEIKSFLGLTNYVSRFIDDYSTKTEPLRRLLKKNTQFQWSNEQEISFNQLKNSLVSDQVMTFFDPLKHSELWVDASPVGVSGILIQNNKIVSYGSRALTPVEQRYSQTEREMLACVWGCEHFHIYLYGKPFSLITDCKPLLSVFTNTKQIQSARLERWRLRLTGYNFKVKHHPGKFMISDYCSRHPINGRSNENIAEEYVKFIARLSVPNSLSLSDIAAASQKDCIITCVMDAVQNNTWTKQTCCKNDSYSLYQQLSDELSVVTENDGRILLRGTKLCIPESLQRQIVNLAHLNGHQGINRCKALLRETCWFPFMDRLVEQVCKSCIPCMSVSPKSTPDPIKPSPLPKQPWDEISIDFCGPFPTGEYFMVLICDYSRYPVVEKLNSLSAQTVIPHIERLFSLFSIPSIVRTDNGTPFNSHLFTDFAKSYGFTHRKITPLHPMANGIAEAFMKPLVKAMKTTSASGENFKSNLSGFLMNYRSTPHPSTGVSPFELMFNRKMKTKLPQYTVPKNDKTIRRKDQEAKEKNKLYADNRRKSISCSLKSGDKVLVKQKVHNKLDTPFSQTPGTVINRNGSMITVKYQDRNITRDASHFKLVPNQTNNSQDKQTQQNANKEQMKRRSKRQHRVPARYMD